MTTKREFLVVVGVSTAIGFAAEIILHSIDESRGKKFKFHFPNRTRALELLAVTLMTGIVVDYAIKAVDKKTMSEVESELAELYEREKKKVKDGIVKDSKPINVVWQPYKLLAKAA